MRTVRVRIAVAVNECGDYKAEGGNRETGLGGIPRWDVACSLAVSAGGAIPTHIAWVEADIPIPEAPTVPGEVKERG